MAEFHFYGSEADSLAILEAILDTGEFHVTPDLHYPTRRVKSYRNVTPELVDAFAVKRGLYITGSFSLEPLHIEKVKGDADTETFYYIDQTFGGPALSITLPNCKKRDNIKWHLGPGDIFYPRSYWDKAITHPIRPSDAVKSAHVRLVKLAKSFLVRRKILVNVWIGRNALSLLESDQALILVNGKWCTITGEVVKLNVHPRRSFKV